MSFYEVSALTPKSQYLGYNFVYSFSLLPIHFHKKQKPLDELVEKFFKLELLKQLAGLKKKIFFKYSKKIIFWTAMC